MSSISKHAADREWAFQALDGLQAFLDDPDFEGDVGEEAAIIDRKRKELREGKYRVLFLGEFNVGKSALVNAVLGGEYLPMVLEECTTKITYVMRAETMRAVLGLSAQASEDEMRALTNLIEGCGIGASVSEGDMGNDITITYATGNPKDLLKSLRPLVTMSADEDFPQLKSLRLKFDEIGIFLPTDLLEEDVALIDSPGVHSISETNTKIAQEVIPNSHLVVCLLDSQHAGNEQNRAFIEMIVKQRHRKLFFVINKADQLNAEEIDPKGRRGPAKDLVRSLRGVVDAPEIFFVSALYALVSAQLSQFHLILSDLDHNNKIKIPWAVQRDLLLGDEPTRGVAEYLMAQSNLAAFQARLLQYLYTENREGALLESVCRFLDQKAWTYARPIQTKLDMARDVPRLDELKAQREVLSGQLEENGLRAQRAREAYAVLASGGQLDGVDYASYAALIEQRVTEDAAMRLVIKPVRQWLMNDANFRKMKKAEFAPLTTEVENALDAFTRNVFQEIEEEVEAVEQRILAMMGDCRSAAEAGARDPIEALRGRVGPLRAGMFGSYCAFTVVGAAVGAVVGAGAASGGALAGLADLGITVLPEVVAGVGAVAGAAIGILLRAATSKRVQRKKLLRLMEEKVRQILLRSPSGSGKEGVPCVRDQLKAALDKRRTEFGEWVQLAFDKDAARLRFEINAVQTEEDEIRRRQADLLARLEPKLDALSVLGQQAAGIAEANAPREGAEG